MTSRSPSSPSEGEIVESDAELSNKAHTAQTIGLARRIGPADLLQGPDHHIGHPVVKSELMRIATDFQQLDMNTNPTAADGASIMTILTASEAKTNERTDDRDESPREDSKIKNELNYEPDAPQEPLPSLEPPIDENKVIEERRQKRKAIKAMFKEHDTSLPVEALAVDKKSAPGSPDPLTFDTSVSTLGKAQHFPTSALKGITDQASPASLIVLDDKDLANNSNAAYSSIQEDRPSAADYDPTMDMQEDRVREDLRQQEELPSSAYDETTMQDQNVLLPRSTNGGSVQKKPKDFFDMFADDDDEDMFAEHPGEPQASNETKAVAIPQAKAFVTSMLDDRDDVHGYYKVLIRELIDGRYDVQAKLGQGVFATVVRANDQKNNNKPVAIKIVRNNDSMKKAGLKEIEILRKLGEGDTDDKKHVIKLQRTFEHASHLCMVFENLHLNLREVLKKFGRTDGLSLDAVRAYATQIFVGLSYFRKCNITHADLKPDNILIDEALTLLKICDLGSASDLKDNEVTPYLVSRFYRAPEIILGLPYDFGIDIWSTGCTLFEIYTGIILFSGQNNNQMLRQIMECRGKYPPKLLRKSKFYSQHFDDLLNFRSFEKDKSTGQDVLRIVNYVKPIYDLKSRIMATAGELEDVNQKELLLFVDLLDKCLCLNPDKRCTPMDALKHPFIKG
ncbi:MAG: hypothetical protein Q9167_004133 [Letrouitia subvulpina]